MSNRHLIAEKFTVNKIWLKMSAWLLIVLPVLFLAFLVTAPLQARDEVKVIALVNSEPITNLELTDRVSYLRRAT